MVAPADRGYRVVVAVLAGGRGTRIGASKAAIELHGRPLVSYPLRAARAAALEAVVVAKRASGLPPLSEPVVHEPDAPQHPLCGIVTALRHSRAAVLAVGCDMPFVSPGLFACLAREGAGSDGRPAAVVAEVDGVVQPLPALYRPAALPALERALISERSLRATLEELDLRVLREGRMRALGNPRRLFLSVNDRGALETAARLLASTARLED